LGQRVFTKSVTATREGLLDFVGRQEEYLRDVIIGLGDANRAALGVAFMRGGRVKAGLDLEPDEEKPFSLLNASIGQVRKSINALEGSLLVKELDKGETYFRFKHPTIRDAYGGVLADDPNLIEVFLRGARPELLVEEITCGDVGLKGVKLIVPPDKYALILSRLTELRGEPIGSKRILSFLVTRCVPDFLADFLAEDPSYLNSIRFPYWIRWSEEAKLFCILHESDLLPEGQRLRLVRTLHAQFDRQPQWPFGYDAQLRSLLTRSEFRSFRAYVRRTLTGRRLSNETQAWKNGWDDNSTGDPDDHFWSWKQQLKLLASEFCYDRRMYRRFQFAERKVEKLIAKLQKDQAKKEGELEAARTEESTSARSVFDDVDA
jgi:hypothetical protein